MAAAKYDEVISMSDKAINSLSGRPMKQFRCTMYLPNVKMGPREIRSWRNKQAVYCVSAITKYIKRLCSHIRDISLT